MATVHQIEELKFWQKARVLSADIYRTTRSKLFFDDPDLKRQIRRAGGSVMDSIAGMIDYFKESEIKGRRHEKKE